MKHSLLIQNRNCCAKLLWLLLLGLISVSTYSQENSSYSFLVGGHAYGAHSGKNIGLHPPLIKKLSENPDSTVFAIFLTGDIVNHSNEASWAQVATELTTLGLESYYVMGNHDNNSIGYKVFEDKHGGDYYSFHFENELFIVLNSTESDRSISPEQLIFLDDVLENANDKWERAFIFFHEVIWNSHEKYKDVRSNSRSRYDKVVNISNFWDEVYPRLQNLNGKEFYLFAGDVGGNPDAIAASFDRWENVTLISSGMGEVNDENYLKVSVLTDSVTFQLIPLQADYKMQPMTWYNIPETPDSIFGPTTIFPEQLDAEYNVTPIFNSTSYNWILGDGIMGSSDSAEIRVRFDNDFDKGSIWVKGVNDGFGESEAVELKIVSDKNTFVYDNKMVQELDILQDEMFVRLNINSGQNQNAIIKVYDITGRVIFDKLLYLKIGNNSMSINKSHLKKGLSIVRLSYKNGQISKKVIMH